jgi:hypothetical protein
MTVYIKIKAVSKRKPLIECMPFTIGEIVSTSNGLVEYIVRRNVEDYNNKAVDAPLFPYLSAAAIDDGAKTGKIGFGDRKNEQAEDADKAVENALTCYSDGIFKLFINDAEIGFNEPVNLKDGDEITFIRLTMLAGRLW